MASEDDKLWDKVKGEYEENIQRVLILGIVHYFPLVRYSDLADQDELEYACRIAKDETRPLVDRGKALGEVETILKRLESE